EDRRRQRMPLDQPAPGEPLGGFADRVLAAGEPRYLPFVARVAGRGQHRWQQRQRRDHREEDRQRGGDGDAVEEGDVQQEHPHQGDDHRRAREEHGAPGGGDGTDRRLLRLIAFVEVVAEAGDDEERVVDPDPEPDHRRQDRREAGRVDYRGAERDQAEPDPEREQRGDDRQPHRHHRAEGEKQDDDRREKADREGGVAAFFFGFGDRLTAQLDFQLAPVVDALRGL